MFIKQRLSKLILKELTASKINKKTSLQVLVPDQCCMNSAKKKTIEIQI